MTLLAEDAYWLVPDGLPNSAGKLWSSARRKYVALHDAEFLAWVASGRKVLPAASEEALSKTLADLGLSKLAPIDLVEVAALPGRNYRAMIRRRAQTLADGGDQVDALLLLKTIGE